MSWLERVPVGIRLVAVWLAVVGGLAVWPQGDPKADPVYVAPESRWFHIYEDCEALKTIREDGTEIKSLEMSARDAERRGLAECKVCEMREDAADHEDSSW